MWAIVAPSFMQSAIKKRAMERKELEEAGVLTEKISSGVLYFRDLMLDILLEFAKQGKNIQIVNKKGVFNARIKEKTKLARFEIIKQ